MQSTLIDIHDSDSYLMIDNFKIRRENVEGTTWRYF